MTLRKIAFLTISIAIGCKAVGFSLKIEGKYLIVVLFQYSAATHKLVKYFDTYTFSLCISSNHTYPDIPSISERSTHTEQSTLFLCRYNRSI